MVSVHIDTVFNIEVSNNVLQGWKSVIKILHLKIYIIISLVLIVSD